MGLGPRPGPRYGLGPKTALITIAPIGPTAQPYARTLDRTSARVLGAAVEPVLPAGLGPMSWSEPARWGTSLPRMGLPSDEAFGARPHAQPFRSNAHFRS